MHICFPSALVKRSLMLGGTIIWETSNIIDYTVSTYNIQYLREEFLMK